MGVSVFGFSECSKLIFDSLGFEVWCCVPFQMLDSRTLQDTVCCGSGVIAAALGAQSLVPEFLARLHNSEAGVEQSAADRLLGVCSAFDVCSCCPTLLCPSCGFSCTG